MKKTERKSSIVRASDLTALGYTRFQIPSLIRRGELERLSRGLYYWTDAPISGQITIAAVGRLVPEGIICLLSALRYHEIGTQNPGSVWIAVQAGYRAPKLSGISVSTVHYGGIFREVGVEVVEIDGVSVRITSPSRTVIDCFRFRNKIGLDCAIEALEESVRLKKVTAEELTHMAKKCRIFSIMRPYMEAIFR